MTEPVKINAMDSNPGHFDSAYITGREHANIQAVVDELKNRFAAGEGIQQPPVKQGKETPGFWENQARGALRTTESMGYGILRGTQAFWDLLDQAATLVSKATGWEKSGVFKHLSEMAEPPQDWTPQTLAQKIISGLAEAPVDIATISALPGSAPVTMGYMGAIRGSKRGLKGAALDAAMGVAMGYALDAVGALRAGVRIPALAALGGAQAKAGGGGAEEIAQGAAVMGGLGLMGGAPDKAKEFKQHQREILQVKRMEEGQKEFQGQMPVGGYETEILHNQGKDRARYTVVELSDLQPSHLAGEGFKRNPEYPEKTQERQYETDKAEQAKVIKNARTYNPAYTINTDPSMINGPPAVTKEGVVLGGNSRVMSLDEVYRNHPDKADLYRNTLEANAADFGLTPEEISGFSRPVLVRVVDSSIKSPADFQRRVRLYNEPPTQAMAAKTEGVSKARLMSDESFRILAAGLEEHGGTLRQYMDKPASKDLIASFLRDGVLDQAEINRMISSKTGLLTEDGKRMVEQVVRGRVFDDPEVINQAPAEAVKKLDLSLPALAQLKARGGEWDIIPKLSDALQAYSRMKAEGFTSPDEYFAQGQMFGRDKTAADPETRALLDAIATKKPTELRAAFEDLARAARADVPDQETFAFYTPETPQEAFDRILQPDRQVGQAMAAEEVPRYGEPKQIQLPAPERKRLEDNRFEGKKTAAELGVPPQLVLTGGPPGAGKSTARRNMGVDESNFVLADADAIKKDAGYEDQADAFHEESSKINKKVAQRAIDEGYNLVYDSLLTNFKLADRYIKETLDKGGYVRIGFTNIDAETSQARALARVLKGETSRVIRPEISVKGYNQSLPTFLELWARYKNNDRVSFNLVDNNVDGQKAVTVFSKENGKLTIYDKNLFDKLMNTPYRESEGGGKYEREESITEEDLQAAAERIRHRARLFRGDEKARPGSGQAQSQNQSEVTRPPYPESPIQKAERIYDGDEEKVSEQMQLFHRNLQLSLFDQLEETPPVSTVRGALVREGVGQGARTLGLAIRRELAETGRVDLRGREAKTAEDVAVLAQVFRNPAYETLRIIYTRDGRIVAHEGISSRMPGFAGAFVERPEKDLYKMRSRMTRLGADGYYLLHNHPSGEVDPSYQDISLTDRFMKAVPGFEGHVIIDSGKYAVLHPDPAGGPVLAKAYDLPGLPPNWQDPLLQPAIPHPLLGREVILPEDVAHLGQQLRNPDGYVTLLYRSKGKVRAIQEVPVGLLMQIDHAHNFIRGQARSFGAQDVVAWGGDTGSRLPKYVEDELIKGGSLLDVVYTESQQAETGQPVSVRESVRPGGGMKFGKFEAGYPAYRVAEDPMRQYQPLVSEEPGKYGRPEDEIVLVPERKKDIRWAGNINLDRVNSPEDIKQGLIDTAEKIKPELEKARRGTISHEETARLADDMGLTLEQLLARHEGQAFNAEEALAARNWLVASAAEVSRMAKIIAAGDARPSEELEFQKVLKRHYAIQSQVAGMTAEAGRALQSFRIMAETKTANLKDLQRTIEIFGGTGSIEEVAGRIAELDTPEGINTTVRQMEKATRWDMFLEAWINGMLSNPVTHATNMLSNALVAGWMIPERMFAASFGKLLNSADAISMQEALQQCYGVIEGIKDGFRMAKESYKQDQPILDSLSKVEGMNRNAITSENLNLSGPAGRAVDLLGTGIRSVGRALTAEDEFFKAVGYRMELRARALRQAQAEGLSGRDAANRIQEIIADPPEDIHMAAIDAARYQTFTRQLTGISQDVQAMAAKHPALRLIIPFVRTPANIMRFTFERTALAPFSKSIRADIMGGGARRDMALARMALGSMVMATAATMAGHGLITGAGPVDKSMRATLRRTGWQPYSIKIGDKYYSYTRLEPLGSLLGLAADAAEILGQASDIDANKLAAACVMSIARNVTSKTYLRGISDLFNVMADPGRYGQKYIQRLVASSVPAVSAQVTRVNDPVMRDARSILETIRSRIPGFSEKLPPRRNLWGKPIVLGGGWGPDIISPIYTSKEHVEPIDQVILDNKVDVGMPSQQIMGVPLVPEEYSRFVELAGNELKDPSTGLGCMETLNQMTKNPMFKRLTGGPDAAKARFIKQTIIMFRDMARREMLKEFPELHQLVAELRQAKVQALTGQ